MSLSTPTETRNKVIVCVIVGLLLLAGGYAGGRFAAPTKTVVTEKVVTVEHQVAVTTVDTDKVVNALLNAIKTVNKQNNIHVVRVTERDPNGVVKTTETVDNKTQTEATTQTQAATQNKTQVLASSTKTDDKSSTTEITKTTERASKPAWSFALQPGVDFAGVFGHTTYNLIPSSVNPFFQHLVLGASIDHRLLGPISSGVWLNSQMSGGLVLRLDL